MSYGAEHDFPSNSYKLLAYLTMYCHLAQHSFGFVAGRFHAGVANESEQIRYCVLQQFFDYARQFLDNCISVLNLFYHPGQFIPQYFDIWI